MVDVLLPLLLLSATVQVAGMLATIYFAYRITRIIGTFFAWTLLIISFLLLTLRNISSLALIFVLPPEDVSRLIEQIGPTGIWPSQVASLVASILLPVSIYKVKKIFEQQKKVLA